MRSPDRRRWPALALLAFVVLVVITILFVGDDADGSLIRADPPSAQAVGARPPHPARGLYLARAGARHHRTGRSGRDVRQIICDVFGRRCAAAIRVAWCESRWNPRAIGGPNVGLFQINYVHRYRGEPWGAFVARFSKPRTNVEFAYRLSRGGRDWSAWSCRPSGAQVHER